EMVKSFTVGLPGDGVAEGNESVILTLSSPGGGAVLGTASTTILTIQDAENSLAFATPAVFVSEAASSVALKVNRTGSRMSTATVHYATSGGTATSGSDFTPRTGMLTFGPGIKTQTITIPLKPDTIAETNESFSVTLSSSSGPTIPLAGATATV